MSACLVCGSQIEPFISFGQMPIANGFLSPKEFAHEYFFELKAAFCEKCTMVQLVEPVDRERMFHEHYAFFSSSSVRMGAHFQQFAERVMRDQLSGSDPFVVEIGSNDGIMLQHFAKAGIRHLGVEPSANVAEVARQKGTRSIASFFDESVARDILAEDGRADALLGANVMCHIPYLHSVVEGARILLKPRGMLIFEDPYLGDIVEKTSYDQIYDEHAFYFSLSSVRHLVEQHGLEVVDVQPQAVHGGSMRYVVAHRGAHPVSDAVSARRAREASMQLASAGTYDQLRRDIERSRDDLMRVLRDLRSREKRIAGYAATSKSTTVTNYCGITPDLVAYISDTTPGKQGKYSPGVHIPIVSHEEFQRDYPDHALLFGWNHAEEIMAKEQSFRDAGGEWIVYVPRVQVLA